MEDQPDSLELHRRRLGVPRLPPPPPPGDEDLPPPEDEDPRPPEDEDVLDLLRREEEAECEAAAREEAEAEEFAFFPGEEPSARSLALKKIRSAAAKANDGVGDKHMESKHMNYTAGAGEVARVLAKFAEEVHVTNLKGVVLVKKKKSQSEFVKEVPWLNPPKLRKYLKKGEENWEDGKFDANNKEHLERRTQRALRHYQGMRRDAKKSGAGRRSFYPEEETRVHRWFVQQRVSGLRVTSRAKRASGWSSRANRGLWTRVRSALET